MALKGVPVAETTWAAALVPWVDAAGRMFANLGVILLVVLMAMFCGAAMFGSARKQERRMGPGRSAPRARGRAIRIILRAVARKQKEAKPWSI